MHVFKFFSGAQPQTFENQI